eukprot:2809572-Rhodomonas_salina.1
MGARRYEAQPLRTARLQQAPALKPRRVPGGPREFPETPEPLRRASTAWETGEGETWGAAFETGAAGPSSLPPHFP